MGWGEPYPPPPSPHSSYFKCATMYTALIDSVAS